MVLGDPDTVLTRASAYSVLAILFQYPGDEVADLLFGGWAAGVLIGCAGSLAELGYESPKLFKELAEVLKRHSESELSSLREEYARLFISSQTKPACQPYSSAYLQVQSGQPSVKAFEVSDALRSWGLEISEEFGYSPEHLALELEFAAYLLERARSGILEGDPDEAEKAERDFFLLLTHMAEWVPRFSECVTREAQIELYEAAGKALKSFIEDEAKFAGIVRSR